MSWLPPWRTPKTPVDTAARALAEEQARVEEELELLRARMQQLQRAQQPPATAEHEPIHELAPTEERLSSPRHRAQQRRDRNLFLALLLLLFFLLYWVIALITR